MVSLKLGNQELDKKMGNYVLSRVFRAPGNKQKLLLPMKEVQALFDV